MSGYDGRTKGKRFRKPQSGNSNLRDRWKHLSADTSDVIKGSTPKLKKAGNGAVATGSNRRTDASSDFHGENQGSAVATTNMGYDIDGDGQVDVREMRLAKFLDSLIESRQKAVPSGQSNELSDSDLHQMRQQAGRLLIAKEFTERNQGQLWRYGSIFAEKNEDQSADFIAEHKKFPKLMAYLESAERKRVMRSSRHVRGIVNRDPHRDEPSLFIRQTWVESVRKVNDATVSKFPLPDLQPKPKEVHPSLVEYSANDDDNNVLTNAYGAIDIDGDGVVDDDEMKLHLRLQEAVLDDPALLDPSARKMQQLVGRQMMARDFVTRNDGKMWLYGQQYKGRSRDEIVDEIASSDRFAKEFNKLRAKERVLTLKSSMGVAGCIAQMPTAELPNDPTHATEFRRVKHRTELLMARRELMKPPEQRMAALLAKTGVVPGTIPSLPFGVVRESTQSTSMNRTRSESQLIGLPRIFETPRRIDPIGSFSVTKWKTGGH